MNSSTSQSLPSGSVLTSANVFMRDFAAYAGRKGIFAALFLALGALVEGLSLILIIPLLGIVIEFGIGAGHA